MQLLILILQRYGIKMELRLTHYGGGGQPIWNTYFYLKEALKTQTPQLIILEGYTLMTDYDFAESSSVIKNTYGLKWSDNKVNAIRASVPEDKYIDYLIEIGQYHNRYSEIDRNDFGANNVFPYFDDYKGSEMSFGLCVSNTRPDIDLYDQTITDVSMTAKNEFYYRACIELAQEHNIPILVVVSPYPLSADEYAVFMQAEQIASEYDVEFINGNRLYDDINIDFATDFADGDHMNYRGCLKWTRYLEKIINTYSLPNRKNDAKYRSWEINAEWINQIMYDHQFLYIGTPFDYIEAIDKSLERYTVVISLDGDYTNEEIDLSSSLYKCFNISEQIFRSGKEGAWVIRNNEIVWSSTEDEYFYHMQLEYDDLALEKSTSGSKQIIFNNVNLKKVKNGLNILIYDNFTNILVEAVGFNAEGNYNCIK